MRTRPLLDTRWGRKVMAIDWQTVCVRSHGHMSQYADSSSATWSGSQGQGTDFMALDETVEAALVLRVCCGKANNVSALVRLRPSKYPPLQCTIVSAYAAPCPKSQSPVRTVLDEFHVLFALRSWSQHRILHKAAYRWSFHPCRLLIACSLVGTAASY